MQHPKQFAVDASRLYPDVERENVFLYQNTAKRRHKTGDVNTKRHARRRRLSQAGRHDGGCYGVWAAGFTDFTQNSLVHQPSRPQNIAGHYGGQDN